MRLSVNPFDYGYDVSKLRSNVYLNGVLQRYVITADEEQGFLMRYIVKDGKLAYNFDTGEVEKEEVWGKVVIEVEDGNSRPASVASR